jgi:hypothetical protein
MRLIAHLPTRMESQRYLALNAGEQLIADATYFKKVF